MDDWNQTHHAASGLLERVRKSNVSMLEAEAQTLAFLEQWVEKDTAPLCGNSIWQDRRFLTRHMPTLESYLHYRIIDVSSLKELARRWRPDLLGALNKQNAHTALATSGNPSKSSSSIGISSWCWNPLRPEARSVSAQSMCSPTSGVQSRRRVPQRGYRGLAQPDRCRSPPPGSAATARS